jgi:hypothetical protein
MSWREQYKVHPAADAFPMMDEQLVGLADDIKAHGLRKRIVFLQDGVDLVLLDGRNRLEAMERAGIEVEARHCTFIGVDKLPDPLAYIASANLHRRHMLKSERAEAIIALAKMAAEKPDHVDQVSKGGRGQKNEIRARALEMNAALPVEQRVSEPTIRRAMAKARDQMIDANPSPYELRQKQKKQAAKAKRAEKREAEVARRAPAPGDFEGWRRGYLQAVKLRCTDLSAEHQLMWEAFEQMLRERDAREAAE